MKSPTIIEPNRSMYGSNKSSLHQINSKTAKNPDLFMTLLVDKMQDLIDAHMLNSTGLPLNNNCLHRLIDIVQDQMNEHLFRELSNFNDDNELSEYHCEGMNSGWADKFDSSDLSQDVPNIQKGKRIEPPNELNTIIEHASNVYEVDPKLIRSVIRAESNFDANATSSKGAMGLMQLMPETAKDLGVKNCYNPVENIMAGARYLKKLLIRYDGNVELSLAAYNWGMGNLEKHPDRLPQETRTYIARVNEFYRKEMS